MIPTLLVSIEAVGFNLMLMLNRSFVVMQVSRMSMRSDLRLFVPNTDFRSMSTVRTSLRTRIFLVHVRHTDHLGFNRYECDVSKRMNQLREGRP